jgi:hypothetical protein
MRKLYPSFALVGAALAAKLVAHWFMPSHPYVGTVIAVVCGIEAKSRTQRRLHRLTMT